MCNRVGWDTGKVLGTYLRYEAAGDQYIGRLVCGLDQSSGSKFAQLPPHFTPGVDTTFLHKLCKLTFLAFGRSTAVDVVLEHCFAIMLLMISWVFANLPSKHPLLHIPLGRENSRHDLKPHLSCDVALDRSGNLITATGIPMNVHILSQCKDTGDKLENLRNGMRDTVLECLQERDYDCGNITLATIQSSVATLLGPLMQRVDDLVQVSHQGNHTLLQSAEAGLRLTRLPSKQMELCTKLTVRQAFMSYVSGDVPWIHVQRHMVVQKQRPYFHNLHYLMAEIIKELKRMREWDGNTPISTERAARLYEMAKHTVPTTSKSGRMLTWRTAATYLGKRKRDEECAQEPEKATDLPSCHQDLPLEHHA